MSLEGAVLELHVPGSRPAYKLDQGWVTPTKRLALIHNLPMEFNLMSVAVHRNGTKTAACSAVPAIDIDVHSENLWDQTMQETVRDYTLERLQAAGFVGVVDRSSENGGLHVRL